MAEEASNNLEATEEINLTEDTANSKQETSTSEEVHSTSGCWTNSSASTKWRKGSTENKNTMKALFLTSNVDCWCGDAAQIAKSFEIRETAVPVPKSGQVLIRVERSPINPSDLSSLKGSYGSTKGKALPYIPGFGKATRCHRDTVFCLCYPFLLLYRHFSSRLKAWLI